MIESPGNLHRKLKLKKVTRVLISCFFKKKIVSAVHFLVFVFFFNIFMHLQVIVAAPPDGAVQIRASHNRTLFRKKEPAVFVQKLTCSTTQTCSGTSYTLIRAYYSCFCASSLTCANTLKKKRWCVMNKLKDRSKKTEYSVEYWH